MKALRTRARADRFRQDNGEPHPWRRALLIEEGDTVEMLAAFNVYDAIPLRDGGVGYAFHTTQGGDSWMVAVTGDILREYGKSAAIIVATETDRLDIEEVETR
jgi:hypothetical protein